MQQLWASHFYLQETECVRTTPSLLIGEQPRRAMRQNCGIAIIQLGDVYGTLHGITVTVIDTITKPLERVSLDNDDKNFLIRNNIHLSINRLADSIRPHVHSPCNRPD
ncbi:hypothetical protein KIN20_010982 [Parelaphostrongylus tenuis]|uniref:Uncharacterized protein n=1 Tax=Parelaphostrongylus tenuis TaxID=148309 RepID=A0AAD5QJ72_PARTN|nr:hypothetical protein KIN20_010982 [Parelaphostrongylus tenuis]